MSWAKAQIKPRRMLRVLPMKTPILCCFSVWHSSGCRCRSAWSVVSSGALFSSPNHSRCSRVVFVRAPDHWKNPLRPDLGLHTSLERCPCTPQRKNNNNTKSRPSLSLHCRTLPPLPFALVNNSFLWWACTNHSANKTADSRCVLLAPNTLRLCATTLSALLNCLKNGPKPDRKKRSKGRKPETKLPLAIKTTYNWARDKKTAVPTFVDFSWSVRSARNQNTSASILHWKALGFRAKQHRS